MPAWVKNPIDYWQAADGHERSNGVLFQQLMIALPIELTLEQRAKLTESIVEEVTGEQKLPYTFAIHKGKGHNPHTKENRDGNLSTESQLWIQVQGSIGEGKISIYLSTG